MISGQSDSESKSRKSPQSDKEEEELFSDELYMKALEDAKREQEKRQQKNL